MDKTGTWQKNLEAVHHYSKIFLFVAGCETEVHRAGEEREVTPWATESAEVRGRLQHQGVCSAGAGHYHWSTGASYRVSHDSQLWVGEGVCTCWWRERECGTVEPWWKTTIVGRPMMRDHAGGRQLCWETTLLVDQLSDRPPRWRTTLMRDDHGGRLLWWETTKANFSFAKTIAVTVWELSIIIIISSSILSLRTAWWESTQVEDHHDKETIGERPPRWKTSVVRNHPGERPAWWKTTLVEDQHNERPPWWMTSIMKDHPGGRPEWQKTTLVEDQNDERAP